MEKPDEAATDDTAPGEGQPYRSRSCDCGRSRLAGYGVNRGAFGRRARVATRIAPEEDRARAVAGESLESWLMDSAHKAERPWL